jgi:hypothetical protein
MTIDRIECAWCATQNELERTSCTNCGARLDVRRTVAASHSVLSQLAASHVDLVKAFEEFARVAQKEWPSLVEVERDGLFARGRARRVVVRVPGRAFIARREGPGLVCEVGTVIRGAIVRTDPVPAAEWTKALQADIAQTLGETPGSRAALRADNPS